MADTDGRPEAAMAIWPWGEAASGATHRGEASRLRRHGSLRGGMALGFATCFWLLGRHGIAAVALSIGGVTLLAALASPTGFYQRMHDTLDAFAHGIGIAITYLCLVPIYLLIITPFGLLMRHGSRDPLHRTWSAQTASFWRDRPATGEAFERRKRPF